LARAVCSAASFSRSCVASSISFFRSARSAAMSFQAQGDCQNATLFFEEVMQGHRSSPVAKTAREKVAECRKAGRR